MIIAGASIEAPDVALLLPGPGFSVMGGVVAELVVGFFASEYPQ